MAPDRPLRHREPANELCPYCRKRLPSAEAVEQHIDAKHARVAYPDSDEARMRRYHQERTKAP